MTLDKCIVLRIGTLTGCPLCRESHPLCRLKNPTVISIWLLVGFHPATRSVQSTPADNTRKRVWQYIEKERKKVGQVHWELYTCIRLSMNPPLRKPNHFRFAMPTSTSSQSLKNILKPPDISYDQYFCKALHWNSETVNAFPQMLISRKNVPVVLE